MSEATPRHGTWHERAAVTVDPEAASVSLPRSLLLELYGHARECHPEECCGLIVGAEAVDDWRAVRCTNVQNARHASGKSDLDARQAFWMDEQELYGVLRAAEEQGEELRAIYHSHVDTAAYLSHSDLRGATGPDGRPLWPGVAYVVLSVWEDGVRGAAWFDWSAAEGRFLGRPLGGT
jgi:proteasome lid subunit RPN8/RPN11